MQRILRIYLEDGLRADAEAGRHNFFRILRDAFVARGFQVGWHRNSPAERIRSVTRPGYALFHAEEPGHARALTVWRAYLYPFWRIENTARRMGWGLAQQDFDPATVDAAEAERFRAFWLSRLAGDVAATGPDRGRGHVFAPLQGRLLEHRGFQTMSPIEMLRNVLAEDLERRVLVTLHPSEVYEAAEHAALAALGPRVEVVHGDLHALLAGADYVVTQNSGAAFLGLFHRRPVVLFAEADFHHVCHRVDMLGPAEALRRAREEGESAAAGAYLYWFLQQGCINAGRPGADEKILARVAELGWQV